MRILLGMSRAIPPSSAFAMNSQSVRLGIKRFIDFLAACILLAVLSPFFAVIAIGVAATTRGSVIFSQRRIGLGGVEFRILKFRTMHADWADGSPLTDDNGNIEKKERDNRVTRFG